MSATDWLVAACCAYVVVVLVFAVRRARQRRRERAEARRLHEARVKAMKLVIDFEHTPVRGASRDRSRPGKARRKARRS